MHHRVEGLSMARSRELSPNLRLEQLIVETEWASVGVLADRVNRLLRQAGSRRVIHRTTPYKWLRGHVPSGPVPALVVRALSSALGRDLAFDDVWVHRGPTTVTEVIRAHEGLDHPWDNTGLQKLLKELDTVPTRRVVLAATGTVLTALAWQSLAAPIPRLIVPNKPTTAVPQSALQIVDSLVASAQAADDAEGSSAKQTISMSVPIIVKLLREGDYSPETGAHLARSLAQICQTLAFMHHEELAAGTSQRLYLMALRAAHAAGDHALVASILAHMSGQAADHGQAADAVQLAVTATAAAEHATPSVRALVAARKGIAHASARELDAFEASIDDSNRFFEQAALQVGAPSWASHADRTELDAIAGRGLVLLAAKRTADPLIVLPRASELLQARAQTPLGGEHQRSALRHGALYSLAQAQLGNLDTAVDAAETALTRLPTVASTRSLMLLRELSFVLDRHSAVYPRARAVVHEVQGHCQRLRLR
ncbi:hypothetical protein AB0N09_05745 [Streptomyces erythrochromogenes]|uniref:hypothetical protein n=1 Tax=Streptomyces erythrochromogenes TaxID=285574 RepID=UPI00342DFACC